MRALFIESKSSNARLWLWGALLLALLTGAVFGLRQTEWTAWAEALPLPWRNAPAAPAAPSQLTEPGPMPVVAEAASEPSAAASADVAAASAPEPADDIDRQVLDFVERWAASWSAKHLDGYFAAYSAQFQPEGKKSLADWTAERKQRIAAKSRIAVQVQGVTIVSSDHSGLKVSFIQSYEADGFRSTSPKVLMLHHQDGAWKIVREYTP